MKRIQNESVQRVSHVKLMGRLGNQLFQIAAAYAHALRSDASLLISGGDESVMPTYYNGFLSGCKQFVGDAPGVVAIEREPHFHYTPIPTGAQSILGYYQSSRYFADVKGTVLALFDPPFDIKAEVAKKYSALMHHKNTVVVHVRRGDYTTSVNIRIHGILTPLYYRAAMAFFRDCQGSDCTFLLFSDDIDYCRAVFGSDAGVICVDEPNESVALHLMSQFRHYVISNSSFSWWAAYLGAPASRVVAPDRWFGPGGPSDYEDVYEPEWIRMASE